MDRAYHGSLRGGPERYARVVSYFERLAFGMATRAVVAPTFYILGAAEREDTAFHEMATILDLYLQRTSLSSK